MLSRPWPSTATVRGVPKRYPRAAGAPHEAPPSCETQNRLQDCEQWRTNPSAATSPVCSYRGDTAIVEISTLVSPVVVAAVAGAVVAIQPADATQSARPLNDTRRGSDAATFNTFIGFLSTRERRGHSRRCQELLARPVAVVPSTSPRNAPQPYIGVRHRNALRSASP